jgi:hypothetical protein
MYSLAIYLCQVKKIPFKKIFKYNFLFLLAYHDM